MNKDLCTYNETRANCIDYYTAYGNTQLDKVYTNKACGKRIKGYNMAS